MTEPGAAPSDHDLAVLSARYRAPLISFFLRRLRDRSDAEDLTQEVFFRIVRHQDLRAEVGDGFIFTIAANVLRDFQRRGMARRRGAHFSLDATPEDAIVGEARTATTEEISPERVLLGRESLARVLKALEDLNPRTRDILLMFHFEGMRQREIATLLGISVSAVEKQVVKALAHLASRTREP